MNFNHNFDREVERDTTILKESKQTIYIAGDPLSPRLHLDAIVGKQYSPQVRESHYRNTQPSFNIQVEQATTGVKLAKSRVETPQLSRAEKVKGKTTTEQKDLLQHIAEAQVRRPNYIYNQQNRRFRNTLGSFASDQSRSSKHDSMHNLGTTISPMRRGNDDLIELNLQSRDKQRRGGRDKSGQPLKFSNLRQQQKHGSGIPLAQPHRLQLTDLAEAYKQGVARLIETLPFQQNKLKPIVSASLDLSKVGRTSPVTAITAQSMIAQMRRSQEQQSTSRLAKASNSQQKRNPLLRKTVNVPLQPSRTDESHQTSGHLHSNRSLSNGYPLQAIRSSIFRVEPAQDYTDLKLDFTHSQKMTNDYQSQSFLESIKNMQSGAQIGQAENNSKVRIKKKLAGGQDDQGDTVQNLSTAGITGAPIYAAQNEIQQQSTTRRYMPLQPQVQLGKDRKIQPDNDSTEQHIMGILDRADYHKLKEHRDPSLQDNSSQQCTCYDNAPLAKRFSQHSVECYQKSGIVMNHHNYRISTSPHDLQPVKKRKSQQPRNVLQIQLRPLKGKAAHLKEYRTMIEQEYGKEKKKKIYETMYQELNNNTAPFNRYSLNLPSPPIPLTCTSGRNSLDREFIQLKLTSELKPSPYVPKRNQHVKLQTISPRGEVQEKIIKLDESNAQQMNTTINSFGGSTTLRHSSSRWKPNQMTQKQFFLFSPSNTKTTLYQPRVVSNNRYQAKDHQASLTVIEYENRNEEKPQQESSIVNLEIEISQANNEHQNTATTAQQTQHKPKAATTKASQGHQVNLGYVGLSEINNLCNAAEAHDYFGRSAVKDANNFGVTETNFKLDESTEHDSYVSPSLPFGRIYSRNSHNQSNISRKTPKLATNAGPTQQQASPPPQKRNNIRLKQQQQSKKPAKNNNRNIIICEEQELQGGQARANAGEPVTSENQENLSSCVASDARQQNNSSLMDIQKSPSPVLAAQHRNNYQRQLLAEQMLVDEQRREQQLHHHVPVNPQLPANEVSTATARDADEIFQTASQVQSLTNIQANEEGIVLSTESDQNENPMDQYQSKDLLAIQNDPRLELFSNPTEVEIIQIVNPKSNPKTNPSSLPMTEWDLTKKKQAAYALKKRESQTKVDESLGPLQKKTVEIKTDKTKHTPVSSITQIGQFYNAAIVKAKPQQQALVQQNQAVAAAAATMK